MQRIKIINNKSYQHSYVLDIGTAFFVVIL